MSDDLTPAEQARAARWVAALFASKGWYEEAQADLLCEANKLDPPETVESLRAERDSAQEELRKSQVDVALWQEQFRLTCDESNERRTERDDARSDAELRADALVALRAERDDLRARLDREHEGWMASEADRYESVDQRKRAECVIRDHIAALDAMRAERDEVNETVKSLQADCEELAVRLGFERAETARLRSTHTEAEAAWERCKRQPRVWKSGDPEPVDVEWVRDGEDDKWHKESANRWLCSVVPSSRTWSSLMDRFGPLTEVLDED